MKRQQFLIHYTYTATPTETLKKSIQIRVRMTDWLFLHCAAHFFNCYKQLYLRYICIYILVNTTNEKTWEGGCLARSVQLDLLKIGWEGGKRMRKDIFSNCFLLLNLFLWTALYLILLVFWLTNPLLDFLKSCLRMLIRVMLRFYILLSEL